MQWNIGEKYAAEDIRHKNFAFMRPAVYQPGKEEVVITSSPCCPQMGARRISLKDLNAPGGFPEKCKHCKWSYRLTPESNGHPRFGLYGVKWVSQGF